MDAMTDTQSSAAASEIKKTFDVFLAGATRQFLERGEDTAQNFMDLNAELVRFVSHRANRNSEAVGRIMQCRSLPELLDAESAWARQILDDYSGAVSRLMDFNARLIGCPTPSREDGEAKGPAMRPARPRQPMPAGVTESA